MKKFHLILILLLALSAAAAASEWISLIPNQPAGSPPQINLISSDENCTKVEIIIPGFYAQKIGDGWDLNVPGWALTQEVGYPSVPMAAFIMTFPDGSDLQTEANIVASSIIRDMAPNLAREASTDNSAPMAPEPQPWIGDYPETEVETGAAGYISKLPVSAILAYPFHVEEATGNLTVASRMTVTVKHGELDGPWPAVALSRNNMARCSSSLINYSAAPITTATSRGGVNYVILTLASCEPLVQPLAEWRSKIGFNVAIETFIMPTASKIKQAITKYPDVEYALIVGDDGNMPLYKWGYQYGDHWYSCITGGSSPDAYPDICVGRLCGAAAARITPQINKILDYEQSPPKGQWLTSTVLVAHKESYPNKYTKCSEEIALSLANTKMNVVKQYGGVSGVTNATVSQNINTGMNIVNYRGHGGQTSWTGWNKSSEYYDMKEVYGRTNGNMTPIVFNGDIRGANDNCLCESWMDAAGGAVAALGAVHASYTIANHDYDKELYNAIYQHGLTDIGSAMNHATDFILTNHGSMGESNAKMYIWLGDPAMRVWLTSPSDLTASHLAAIGPGSQTFDVTVTSSSVPVPDANVICYKDGDVSVIAKTAANGKAILTIAPSSAGTMYVTVTHPEFIPYEGSVAVGSAPFMANGSSISANNGGQINFVLNADTVNANRNYIILGTASGTSPGTQLPGGMVTIPINFDYFTKIQLALIGSPAFVNFLGKLDSLGQGKAQFNTDRISSTYVGMVLNFAYALNKPWNYVSNPIGIVIDP